MTQRFATLPRVLSRQPFSSNRGTTAGGFGHRPHLRISRRGVVTRSSLPMLASRSPCRLPSSRSTSRSPLDHGGLLPSSIGVSFRERLNTAYASTISLPDKRCLNRRSHRRTATSKPARSHSTMWVFKWGFMAGKCKPLRLTALKVHGAPAQFSSTLVQPKPNQPAGFVRGDTASVAP